MTRTTKKTAVIIAALALLAAATALLIYGPSLSSQSSYIDPADKPLVASGKPIYLTYCASCHGANLEGQADWRIRKSNGRLPAPPHDESGHTWHHADSVLMEITRNGLVPGVTAPEGYVSDMPAYSKLLNDHQIRAVLAYIKSSWSKQARDRQKQITQQ